MNIFDNLPVVPQCNDCIYYENKWPDAYCRKIRWHSMRCSYMRSRNGKYRYGTFCGPKGKHFEARQEPRPAEGYQVIRT